MTFFTKKIRSACLAILLSLSFLVPASAWFGESVPKDGSADLMMMDNRYPYWSESIYNAFWNSGLKAENGDYFSFYGGWTMGVPSDPQTFRPQLDSEAQKAYRPGSVWSFWGANSEGEPVRIVACSEYTFPRQYIGEGASGALPTGRRKWDMVTYGRWYTQLLRVWKPVTEDGKSADHAFVGRWMKDQTNDRWHLYGIARIPAPVSGFYGNAQFLEDFANSQRSPVAEDRRRGYYRANGEWRSSNTVSIDVALGKAIWAVRKDDARGVLSLELGNTPENMPFSVKGGVILERGKTHEITVEQPAKPSLDAPVVEKAEAKIGDGQVVISWQVPASASPQFGYKIELIDTASGEVEQVIEKRDPVAREVVVASGLKKPMVRFSLIDVFDQSTEPVVVMPRPVENLMPAVSSTGAEPGLAYRLYAPKSVNEDAPPLSNLKDENVIQRGFSQGYDATLGDGRTRLLGFKMRGLLRVPANGIYLIHARVADGFRMKLGDRELFNNDELRGPKVQTVALRLAKGDHAVELDNFHLNGLNPFFLLEWESAAMPRRAIKGSDFYHLPSGDASPAVSLSVAGESSGAPKITLDVDPRGTKLEKVRLFLGGLEIASSTDPHVELSELLPSGEHQLYARIYYDGGQTIDSTKTLLKIPRVEFTGLKEGVIGEKESRFNMRQQESGAYEFVGEGDFIFTREVEGDFTVTAKVEDLLGRKGELVNGVSCVGLTTTQLAEGHRYSGAHVDLHHIAKYGLRSSADFADLGAGQLSRQTFPQDHQWLRLTRKGNAINVWTSADGRDWAYGTTHFQAYPVKMNVGLMVRAKPQNAQTFFRALVSNFSIEAGIVEPATIPGPQMASGTKGARVLGVVSSPSDPQVVALRSATRGIHLSSDGGQSWKAVNQGLSNAANRVRSVAFDPSDPQIIWRASEDGLFKSENSGAKWSKLDFPGDFDATGPSGLCGEIIAINRVNSQIVVVGSESKGLFRSIDGGATWSLLGAVGQRFTAVGFHSRQEMSDQRVPLLATTCPDRWMKTLGRGEPTVKTTASDSFVYLSHHNGEHLQARLKYADVGIYNLGLTDPSDSVFFLGTSHGLIHTFRSGADGYLLASKSFPADRLRPFTALGSTWPIEWPKFYATAINPADEKTLTYCRYSRDLACSRVAIKPPEKSAAWLKLVPVDNREKGDVTRWWALRTDGLWHLNVADGGMSKVSLSQE